MQPAWHQAPHSQEWASIRHFFPAGQGSVTLREIVWPGLPEQMVMLPLLATTMGLAVTVKVCVPQETGALLKDQVPVPPSTLDCDCSTPSMENTSHTALAG